MRDYDLKVTPKKQIEHITNIKSPFFKTKTNRPQSRVSDS